MRLSADGGSPEFTGVTLTSGDSKTYIGFFDLHLSPDGTRIAFTKHTPNSELWAIDNIPALLKAAGAR